MSNQTKTTETGISQLPSKEDHPAGKCLMSRRKFLLSSGVATSTVMVSMNTGMAATQMPAIMSTYPRKKIGKLSALKDDAPVGFEYPDEGAYAQSMLVKLGAEAGGGVAAICQALIKPTPNRWAPARYIFRLTI